MSLRLWGSGERSVLEMGICGLGSIKAMGQGMGVGGRLAKEEIVW